MRSAGISLLLVLAVWAIEPVTAQSAWPPTMRVIAPPKFPSAMELIPTSASASDAGELWVDAQGQRVVRNVTEASLIPVLPPASKRNGAAVIIAPGGGFAMLSMDGEGLAVARRFADRGIAAFVLKYHLNPTPVDQKAFLASLALLAQQPPLRPGQATSINMPEAAVNDGLAAIRLVRQRATSWGLDPRRVGMSGFSAGAMMTLGVISRADDTTMPTFVGIIYGPMGEIEVPRRAPPLFAALALDDMLFGQMGFGIVQSWQDAHHPVELHAYQHGNHGFGLGTPGTTSPDWFDSFTHWLSCNGMMTGCV